MRIAVLGGGGFRVPLIYDALLRRARVLRLEDVTLHDIDGRRLAAIAPVLEGIARERGERLTFRPTLDLDEAIDGADFVFCAIRVGKLEGRVIDESVPLEHGVIGQETVGPGGIAFALRTVPVMLDVAERVAKRAPDAWFVNFTNPAGLVTEAVQGVLGHRVMGICDTPAGLFRRVARVLERDPDGLRFDYFGLNHLGWLRAVYDGERDLLPALLADGERLGRLEEGRLFGAAALRELGMIPNEYLYFYYHADETVTALRDGIEPRADFLKRQQDSFYDAAASAPGDALDRWRATRREREDRYFAEARSAAGLGASPAEPDETGGYAGEALAVVEALVRGGRRSLVLDTANRGSLPFLDASAIVEVPCVVTGSGPVPAPVGDVPEHCRTLIEAVKGVERTTIRAAIERSRRLAVRAIAQHPLVPSRMTAQRIFDGYADRHPELRAWSRRSAGASSGTDPARGVAPAAVDVHLTGTVYVDMIFATLPGPPLPGRELRTASVGTSPGGVANLAVALRRLGLSVRLDAAFATDTYADYLWRTLAAEGVDLGGSVRMSEWASPLTVSLAFEADRFMVTYERPPPVAVPGHVDDRPPDARCAFVGVRDIRPRWLERAREAGLLVFADVGWDETERWPKEDLEVLAYVDAFLPNLDEALAYTRTGSAEEAARCLVETAPLVVVKCGPGGAVAWRAGERRPIREPAIDVEAIDSTGAGDVFDAAFMFGTLAGWTLREVLRFSNLCAGLSVRHHGGSLSAPSWGEVSEWIGRSPERATEYGFLHRYLGEATECAPPQRAHRTL